MKKILILSMLFVVLLISGPVKADELSVPTEETLAEESDNNIKTLLNQLKVSLSNQNTIKKTYLGFVSSAKGKALVESINKAGENVTIITTKTAFCAMKKLSDNSYYCIDNLGHPILSNLCTKTNISCASKKTIDTAKNIKKTFQYTNEQLISIITKLIELRKNPPTQSTAELVKAIKDNNLQQVKELLKETNVNVLTSDGQSILSLALLTAHEEKSMEIIKEIIKTGADINIKDITGQTPLLMAATSGATSSISLLISAGADVNAKDPQGKTALMWAAMNNNTDLANLLISAGADVNAKDLQGKTALNYAQAIYLMSGIFDEGIKMLKEAGAKE